MASWDKVLPDSEIIAILNDSDTFCNNFNCNSYTNFDSETERNMCWCQKKFIQ